MVNTRKVSKFVKRLQHLVMYLEAEQRNLQLHQQVNHFFYLERIAELNTLVEQFEEVYGKMQLISVRLEVSYQRVFYQWRHDILWIHRCERCGVKDRLYQSFSI